jgi:hypothetical protein
MKKFFKNLLLSAAVVLSITSCGWLTRLPRNNETTTEYGTSMKYSYTMTASNWQVDSICRADALPNIDEWIVNGFTDYETGEQIVKRLYMKAEGEKEVIYIITGSSEPYKVERRITE